MKQNTNRFYEASIKFHQRDTFYSAFTFECIDAIVEKAQNSDQLQYAIAASSGQTICLPILLFCTPCHPVQPVFTMGPKNVH